jgi:hypothetical protein
VKEKEYIKLPGASTIGIAAYSKLYLAKDHLLLVLTTGFAEDYKRFYFKDIQAITIRKTEVGKILNLICISLTVLGAIPTMFFFGKDFGTSIFWSCFAAVFLLALVINSFLGATCVSTIKTAVQNEKLSSLGRLPRARKVLASLQPLIAQAQGGELTPEEASIRMRELTNPPGEQTSFAPPFVSDQPLFTEPPAEPPPAAI